MQLPAQLDAPQYTVILLNGGFCPRIALTGAQ